MDCPYCYAPAGRLPTYVPYLCTLCSGLVHPQKCGYCGGWFSSSSITRHGMCSVCQGTGGIKSDNTCTECENGKTLCTTCDGDGQIETSGPCTAHTISSVHYYCTSNSHHGNNVGQYHK